MIIFSNQLENERITTKHNNDGKSNDDDAQFFVAFFVQMKSNRKRKLELPTALSLSSLAVNFISIIERFEVIEINNCYT